MKETETKIKKMILGAQRLLRIETKNPIDTKSRDSKRKERTQVKENLPEEEKDYEPPRKIKRGHNR